MDMLVSIYEDLFQKLNKTLSILPLLSSPEDSELLDVAVTLKELSKK